MIPFNIIHSALKQPGKETRKITQSCKIGLHQGKRLPTMFLFCFVLFIFNQEDFNNTQCYKCFLVLSMFGYIHLRIAMEFLPQLWALHPLKRKSASTELRRMGGLSPLEMESYYFKFLRNKRSSNLNFLTELPRSVQGAITAATIIWPPKYKEK